MVMATPVRTSATVKQDLTYWQKVLTRCKQTNMVTEEDNARMTIDMLLDELSRLDGVRRG